MATLTEIRNGLKARLEVVDALRGRVYTRWPSQMDFPCAIVMRGRAEPEQTFGDGRLTRYDFEVYLLASLAPGYDQAIANLDPLVQTSSTGGIYTAIHNDRTLGGIAASTFVHAFREEDQVDLGDNVAVTGFVIELEVWAS